MTFVVHFVNVITLAPYFVIQSNCPYVFMHVSTSFDTAFIKRPKSKRHLLHNSAKAIWQCRNVQYIKVASTICLHTWCLYLQPEVTF